MCVTGFAGRSLPITYLTLKQSEWFEVGRSVGGIFCSTFLAEPRKGTFAVTVMNVNAELLSSFQQRCLSADLSCTSKHKSLTYAGMGRLFSVGIKVYKWRVGESPGVERFKPACHGCWLGKHHQVDRSICRSASLPSRSPYQELSSLRPQAFSDALL